MRARRLLGRRRARLVGAHLRRSSATLLATLDPTARVDVGHRHARDFVRERPAHGDVGARARRPCRARCCAARHRPARGTSPGSRPRALPYAYTVAGREPPRSAARRADAAVGRDVDVRPRRRARTGSRVPRASTAGCSCSGCHAPTPSTSSRRRRGGRGAHGRPRDLIGPVAERSRVSEREVSEGMTVGRHRAGEECRAMIQRTLFRLSAPPSPRSRGRTVTSSSNGPASGCERCRRRCPAAPTSTTSRPSCGCATRSPTTSARGGADGLHVEVFDGIALLHGVVSPEVYDVAPLIAEGVAGVRMVDNRLKETRRGWRPWRGDRTGEGPTPGGPGEISPAR